MLTALAWIADNIRAVAPMRGANQPKLSKRYPMRQPILALLSSLQLFFDRNLFCCLLAQVLLTPVYLRRVNIEAFPHPHGTRCSVHFSNSC